VFFAPVNNSSGILLTLVKHAKTEKASLTSVIDNGEYSLTSVKHQNNRIYQQKFEKNLNRSQACLMRPGGEV
jgi:hypothetical protein